MIKMDKDRCVDCGECVRECYGHFVHWVEGKVTPPAGECLECGHCVAVCPQEAITMVGYDVAQVRPFDKGMMIPDGEKLLAAMQYRRSSRRYKKKTLPQEVLMQVLEAARYGPTAGNSRTMRPVVLAAEKMSVVKQAAKILYEAKLAGHPETEGFNQEFLEMLYQSSLNDEDKICHGAPAVILLADKAVGAIKGANGYIAAARMELMAQALGLGSCYIGMLISAGRIDPTLFDVLHLPEGYEVDVALAVGYPKAFYRYTVPKKPLEVSWL